MGIPFDFNAMAQGLGQGASIIQQYLMDKYMRGQDMNQFKQQQSYLDRLAQGREERQYGRQLDYLQESSDIQDEMDAKALERRARLESFQNNPEYMAIVQKAQSPEANLGDITRLLGIQGVLKKQANIKDLSDEDWDFVGNLPPSLQLQFFQNETANKQYREGREIQRMGIEKELEFMRTRMPYYDLLAQDKELGISQDIEGAKQEKIENVDELKEKLYNIQNQYTQALRDPIVRKVRLMSVQGKRLDEKLQVFFDEWTEAEKIYKDQIKYYQDRIDQATQQSIDKTKKTVIDKSKEQVGEDQNVEETEGLIQGTKPPTIAEQSRTVPEIPPRILAKVRELRPDLTEEQIRRVWIQAGGKLTDQERRILGLDEEDELKFPGSWAGR